MVLYYTELRWLLVDNRIIKGTLEFQIEDTARKNLTRLKKSTRIILIQGFSLQTARYIYIAGLFF